MKITMTQTRRGSEDGFTVRVYDAGETYDVAHTLAAHFLKSGFAYNSEPEPEQPSSSSSALERVLYDMSMAQGEFDKLFRTPEKQLEVVA